MNNSGIVNQIIVVLDDSPSDADMLALTGAYPDAKILMYSGGEDGEFYDKKTGEPISNNMSLSGNTGVYLIGKNTPTTFGGLDSGAIGQVINGLGKVFAEQVNITDVNLVGGGAAGARPDQNLGNELQKKYSGININSVADIPTVIADAQRSMDTKHYGALLSALKENGGSGDTLFLDFIRSLRENPTLYSEVNNLIDKYKSASNEADNMPFMKKMRTLSGFRKEIEQAAIELAKRFSTTYQDKESAISPLALMLQNDKPMILTSYISFMANIDDQKKLTAAIFSLGNEFNPERKRTELIFSGFKNTVLKETTFSVEQARKISDHAQSLLKQGPLVIGEQHSKTLGRSLIEYLMGAGGVKNLFVEAFDIGLFTDSDIHDIEMTEEHEETVTAMKILRGDIFSSGAKTLSEYVNNFKPSSDINGVLQKHMDDYFENYPDYKEMISGARSHGVKVYFVDDPTMRLDILQNHNHDSNRWISGVDARNQYMGEAYKSIINGGDGAGSIVLVGASHLYDSQKENVNGVWKYMEVSVNQTLDTMSLVGKFNDEFAPKVTREREYLFPKNPITKNMYPDEESAAVHAYPGTELYNEYHSDLTQSYDGRIIVIIGEVDEATDGAMTSLAEKNPDARIFFFKDGVYSFKDSSGKLTSVKTLNMSGRIKVELVGHGSATSLGGLDAQRLVAAVRQLQDLMGKGATVGRLNLVGCDTAGEGPGQGLSDTLRSSFPGMDIKGYQGTIAVDDEGHKIPVLPGDVNALPDPDMSISGDLYQRLLQLAKFYREERKGKNTPNDTIDFKALEHDIAREAVKLYDRTKGVLDGKTRRDEKFITALQKTIEKHSDLLSFLEMDAKWTDDDWHVGSTINEGAQAVSIVNDEFNYAKSLLDNGTLILGECHGTKPASLIINHLISKHDVTDLFLEMPDVSMFTGEDISEIKKNRPDLAETISGLQQDIKKSGAKTFSEYFERSDRASMTPEQRLHLNAFSVSCYSDYMFISEKAKSNGVKIHFIDLPFHHRNNIMTGVKNSIDERNKYMADSIDSVIKNQSSKSIVLVGASHLYNSTDGAVKSIQHYLGLSDNQTFDVSDEYLGENYTKHINRISDINNYPQSYLDDDLMRQYVRPGSVLYRALHPEMDEQATGGAKQRLLSHEDLLSSGAKTLSDIVTQFGGKVHFAPQSFLLGDDGERGVCASLSQAWLFTLGEDNPDTLRNTLLNDVFLRSQALVDNASLHNHLPETLSEQTRSFLSLLGALTPAASHHSQSLADIIQALATSPEDISFTLDTGNHAMAVARRTLNGTASYYFYDPNFGEVYVPVGQDAISSARALRSIIEGHLNQPVKGARLADFYQVASNAGNYTFEVTEFSHADAAKQPGMQALKTLLLQDSMSTPVTPAGQDTPKDPAAMDPLSVGIESLRRNLPQLLDTFAAGQDALSWQQQVNEKALGLKNRIISAVSQDGMTSDSDRIITGITPTDGNTPGSFLLDVVYHNGPQDTEIHHVVVSIGEQDIPASAGNGRVDGLTPEQERENAAGFGELAKAQNVYGLLTSLIGLVGATEQGKTQAQAINGTFVALSVSDLTGLADKLADRMGRLLGVDTSVFGGGVNGLLGKASSVLASLAGVGEEMAGEVGVFMARVPVLGAGILGFTLYSGIEAVENTTGNDQDKAIASLVTNSTSGIISLGLGVGAMLDYISSEATGGAGALLAGLTMGLSVFFNTSDPLGLTGLIDPSMIKNEDRLKSEEKLFETGGDNLTAVRTPTDGGTYLSFIRGAGDIPEVKALLNDPLFSRVLSTYRSQYSGDALRAAVQELYDNKLTVLPDVGTAVGAYTPIDGGLFTEADVMSAVEKFKEAHTALFTQSAIDGSNWVSYLLNPDVPIPKSAHNGDLDITLDEGGSGYTMSWITTPVLNEDVNHGGLGPMRVNPVHKSLMPGEANNVLMSIGQSDSVRVNEGNGDVVTSDAWNQGAPSDRKTGVDTDVPVKDFNIVPYERWFSVTGNSADNNFYSVYGNATNAYTYNVYGGAGDDALFVGQFGTYHFDGGVNGPKGDTVVASKAGDGQENNYTLYDLDAGHSPVVMTGLTMRDNFSVSLSGVENIQGSVSNEVFHGSAGKNTIITGGGQDEVWLSGGGDMYTFSIGCDDVSSLVIHGQKDRAADADRDIVVLDSEPPTLVFERDAGYYRVTTLPEVPAGMTHMADAQVKHQILLKDGADQQVVLTTGKGFVAQFYCDDTGTGVAIQLDSPDESTLKMLVTQASPLSAGLRSMHLPGGEVITLDPALGFKLTTRDTQSGGTVTRLYATDSDGNLVATRAWVSLNQTLKTLDASVLWTLQGRAISEPGSVEFSTSDGIVFHLVQTTDAVSGTASHHMVVDSIDPARYTQRAQDGHRIFGESAPNMLPGTATLVADITSLLSDGNTLYINPAWAGTTVLKVAGGGNLLSAGALAALQVGQYLGGVFGAGSGTPVVGTKVSLANGAMLVNRFDILHPVNWEHLVLQVSDANGLQTEVHYAADGSITGYIMRGIDNFISLNVALLAEASLGGISPVEWVSKDGVSFHFSRDKGRDGNTLCSMVIDGLAAGKGVQSPLAIPDALALPKGLDQVVVNLDGMTSSGQRTLALSRGEKTLLRTTVASADLARLSTCVPVYGQGGETLTLPDGSTLLTTGGNWSQVTLMVHVLDTKEDWILNYADTGAGSQPELVQAISTNPLEPDYIENGNVHHTLRVGERGAYTANLQMNASGTLTVQGDAGDNIITGVNGNPNRLLGGKGNDTLNGGAKDDWFVGGDGADHITGGGGNDTVQYMGNSEKGEGVLVNLSQTVQQGGEAEGDRLAGISNVVGSQYGDILYGNAGNNALYGGAGNDTLGGLGGTDLLVGGRGADAYVISQGDEVVISQQDNGTATDILDFDRTEAESLSFALSGNDLVVSSVDRVALLKDWLLGDNHYRLNGESATVFAERVKTGLEETAALKNLSGLYHTLKTGAFPTWQSVAMTGNWTTTQGGQSLALTPAEAVMPLNGPVVADRQSSEAFDATADYSLTLDVQGTPLGIKGFHARLKAGSEVLGEYDGSTAEVPSGSDMSTLHVDLKVAHGTHTGPAAGKIPVTVELEEEKGAGGVILSNLQLQKLGNAMASFNGSDAGAGTPGVVVPEGLVPETLAPQRG